MLPKKYNLAFLKKYLSAASSAAFLLFLLSGCGLLQSAAAKTDNTQETSVTSAIREASAIAAESAKDAQIDFAAVKKENPDIFSWIYIPDTEIDYPLLQSTQSDDFYENHNVYGENDDAGALYIELANLNTLCDFNTVIHGKTGREESGMLADLYKFSDLDFFNDHESIYLSLSRWKCPDL